MVLVLDTISHMDHRNSSDSVEHSDVSGILEFVTMRMDIANSVDDLTGSLKLL